MASLNNMKKIVSVIGFISAIIGAGFSLVQLFYALNLGLVSSSEEFMPFALFFGILAAILAIIGWKGWKRWASLASLTAGLGGLIISIAAFVIAELSKTCC